MTIFGISDYETAHVCFRYHKMDLTVNFTINEGQCQLLAIEIPCVDFSPNFEFGKRTLNPDYNPRDLQAYLCSNGGKFEP